MASYTVISRINEWYPFKCSYHREDSLPVICKESEKYKVLDQKAKLPRIYHSGIVRRLISFHKPRRNKWLAGGKK